jgi:hypothetical protein
LRAASGETGAFLARVTHFLNAQRDVRAALIAFHLTQAHGCGPLKSDHDAETYR